MNTVTKRPVFAVVALLMAMSFACSSDSDLLPAEPDARPEAAVVGSASPDTSDTAPGDAQTPGDDIPFRDASIVPPTEALLPSGAVAFFYRVSYGETEDEVIVATDRGSAIIGWEEGSRGIARYIPETGEVDVIRTITTSSFSESAIYPITVGGRLYAVRDWGADWNLDDTHFTIEELDPITGEPFGRVDIDAEWFSIAGDEVYYRSEIRTNLFGEVTAGGDYFAIDMKTEEVRQLNEVSDRVYDVGGALISVRDGFVNTHGRTSGAVVDSVEIAADLIESLWPHEGRMFQGDSAVYWAIESSPSEITVVAAYPDGSVRSLFSLDPEEDVDLVIDEDEGLLLVGGIDSSGTRGLAVTSFSTVDLESGEVVEYSLDQFVGSARAEAGGGVQLLRLP